MSKILSSGFKAVVALAASALLAFSCTKDNQGGGEGSIPEVLGTYEFDGDVYDILTASFERSETFLTFVFSPLYGEGLSTYLAFAVDPYWADGEVHKVNDPAGENLDHNDDYILVYEDPVHYYSQYREPEEGWFRVTESGEAFKVELDIRLADGTPLKISYDGEYLTEPAPEE